MKTNISDETSALVLALAEDSDAYGAAVRGMVERLRRLEDQARLEGVDSQGLQKIMSARHVLGDQMDFGPVEAPFEPK